VRVLRGPHRPPGHLDRAIGRTPGRRRGATAPLCRSGGVCEADVTMADVSTLQVPMELRLEFCAVVGLHDMHAKRQTPEYLVDKLDGRALVARVEDLEDSNPRAIVNGRELKQSAACRESARGTSRRPADDARARASRIPRDRPYRVSRFDADAKGAPTMRRTVRERGVAIEGTRRTTVTMTSVLTPRGTNALVDRRGKTTENPKVLCGRRSESKPVGFSELERCRR
jgi:hypothetical protein